MSNKESVLISNQTFECLVSVLHKKPELRKVFDNEKFAKQLLISALEEDGNVENGFWNTGLVEEFFESQCI